MEIEAYRDLVECGAAFGEVDPVMPCTLDSADDVFIRNVLDSGRPILVNVTLVNDSLDLVLRLAQPAFFEIVEDDFQSRLLAGDEAGICHCDIEVA